MRCVVKTGKVEEKIQPAKNEDVLAVVKFLKVDLSAFAE
jgi:hypothetical protein